MNRLQVLELNKEGPLIKQPRLLPHPVVEPPAHHVDQHPPSNEADQRKREQLSLSPAEPIASEE